MSNAMVYTAGSLRVDVQDERVFLNNVPVPLGHKSFALLLALLQSPQRMLTKDELIEAVWDGRAVSDGVLTTAMRELRQALKDNARHPHFIQTVHGRGYRFLLDVDTKTLAPEPYASELQGEKQNLGSKPERETVLWRAWPVAALAVVALTVFGFILVRSTLHKPSEGDTFATSETLNSVIVIPFSDLSPNGGDVWFAGGLTQELLTSLGQVSDLDVIGVDRAALSEVGSINGAQLAQDLGIESAVEGSVRRDNGRIRVTVQLSRAEDGVVVWSEAYDRADSEIISIQEDLAFELANSLNTVADANQLRAMSGAGTSSVEAYQAMLSGHFFLSQQYATGDASYRRLAYDEYERARQIDPEFSEAHWLAARYWLERSTYIVPPGEAQSFSVQEVSALFESRIERAIETELFPLERSKYLAARHMHRLEVGAASRLLQDYLEERPNDAYAWVQLAEASTIRGDFETGRRAAKRVAKLSEQQTIYRSRVIPIFLWVRDINGSVAQADRLLMEDPDNAFIQYHAHRTLLWAGEFDRARSLTDSINQGALPAHNRALSRIRQACADLDAATAKSEYAALLSNETASRASLWLAGRIVGETEAANESLRDLDRDAYFHQLAAWFRYPHFDVSEFENLRTRLQADGIEVAPSVPLPFRCNRSDRG